MEKKQSSIEWLNVELTSLNFDYLTGQVNNSEFSERNKLIMEQAKAMHKEEIENAYVECWMNDGGNGFHKVKEAEQYYNETFGGNNE